MITIIASTNRADSMTEVVSKTIYELLVARGAEVKLYSIKELPTSFLHAEMYSSSAGSMDQIIDDYIKDSEKFIFVIPEYNGSYPGILKLFIDAIHPKFFRGKKAGIIGISDGHSGNLRGQDHLTGVLHYLKMHVHFFQPKLSAIDKLIADQKITDARAEKLLNELADYMLKF